MPNRYLSYIEDNFIEINLAKISQNLHILKSKTKSEIGVVVKANSYNLGASKVTRVLYDAGCRKFFVAHLSEGIELRGVQADTEIYVLHGLRESQFDYFIKYDLIPVINSIEEWELYIKLCYLKNIKPNLILHFDTGINRLGIRKENIQQILNHPSYKDVNILYIMSHLASAHLKECWQNEDQHNNFLQIIKFFPNIKRTFANSSAIFLDPKYHFDLVRPGMALYGLNPTPYLPNPMLNTVTIYGKILQIYQTQKDEFIGYSKTYKALKGTIIAVVAVGYADGMFTHLSNKASVYINNQEAPIIGRISMDMLSIDVSKIKKEDLYVGQVAEVIGDNNRPEKLANIIGCNEYEIIIRLGNRFRVTYVE